MKSIDLMRTLAILFESNFYIPTVHRAESFGKAKSDSCDRQKSRSIKTFDRKCRIFRGNTVKMTELSTLVCIASTLFGKLDRLFVPSGFLPVHFFEFSLSMIVLFLWLGVHEGLGGKEDYSLRFFVVTCLVTEKHALLQYFWELCMHIIILSHLLSVLMHCWFGIHIATARMIEKWRGRIEFCEK